MESSVRIRAMAYGGATERTPGSRHRHQEPTKALTRRGSLGDTVTAVVPPKQPPLLRDRDWYPFYAGFTEAFVDSVVSNELGDAKSIIDPWNGTGTTTVVCERTGLRSFGNDINPVLTVIARARLTPISRRTELTKMCSVILSRCAELPPYSVSEDLLTTWIQPVAVRRIRAIQQAIHNTTEMASTSISPARVVDEFTHLTSFFYCALFGVVRSFVRRFRTTNPMWIKTPPTLASRIRPSWTNLHRVLEEQVALLCCRLTVRKPTDLGGQASLMTGNAMELPIPNESFDGAITSPPYATRIDYVRGTLPELALLGANRGFVANLRRAVTGTPVVREVTIGTDVPLASETAKSTLRAVSSHSSKGSASYYLPWLRNYFHDLQSSVIELSRIVRAGGRICMVVQDSYYKEYRVDLQSIVIEMMGETGRSLDSRSDFSAPNPRSQEVRSSDRSGVRYNTETVLVFS